MKKTSMAFILCMALLLTLLPQTAFATEVDRTGGEAYSASRSVQGAMAGRYYEKDGTGNYQVIPEMYYTLDMANGMYKTYYLGVNTANRFVPTQNIDTAEMVIRKDGTEVSREKIAIGTAPTRTGAINGLSYGILYSKTSGGLVSEIDGRINFQLSTDVFRYYTQLPGEYEVVVHWTADGTSYTAAMTCEFSGGKNFSSLYINSMKAGIITDYSGRSQEAEQTVFFDYSKIEAYDGQHWDNVKQAWIDGEVTELFLYTDSSMDGIFDYAGCSSSEFQEIFTTGEAIRFDENTQTIPLCVRPNLMTEDMIGKSCVLTFQNGNVRHRVTVQIREKDVSFLQTNTIYAVDNNSLHVVAADSDGTVKLCYGSNDMEYSMQEQAELRLRDGGSDYVFIKYQNGRFKSVPMLAPTGADAGTCNMTLQSSENGVYRYRMEALRVGEVSLQAADGSGLRVPCKVDFPYLAFFSTRERTEAAYQPELHYISAVERGNQEVYFYLMSPARRTTDQRHVTLSLTESFRNDAGQWVEKEYEEPGISFAADGLYSDPTSGENFFVWKMTITDRFTMDEQNRWKNLSVYGGVKKDADGNIISCEYGYGGGIRIFDATEIAADEQLYWFHASNIKVVDGKAVLDNAWADSLDQCARDECNQWSVSGKENVYFAIKKNGDYYIVDTPVSSDAPDKVLIHKKNDGVYVVDWRRTGKYLLSTTFAGKHYYIKMNVTLSDTGFYSKNEPNEKWLLEEDEFYFNEALDKSTDGTEAYFYLISKGWNVDMSCAPVFIERDSESQENVEVSGAAGITLGTVQKITWNNETYYSWKIAVSDAYREPQDASRWIQIGLKKNGEIVEQNSIGIYDKTQDLPAYGNMNDDWAVNAVDVLYLKRYLAGWYGYNNVTKRIADLNQDGMIDSADAMILDRHVAGWREYESLPRPTAEQKGA